MTRSFTFSNGFFCHSKLCHNRKKYFCSDYDVIAAKTSHAFQITHNKKNVNCIIQKE